MDTAQDGNREQFAADPLDAARAEIAEATEVISSTRPSMPEHAAAYRRRADAWRQLAWAQSLPDDLQLTSTMLHAAADDLSRALMLSERRGNQLPPPR